MSDRVNPDCEVGKHPACNEDAWDDVTDRPTVCECACHEPTEPDAGPLGSGHSPSASGGNVADSGGSVEEPSTHLIHGSASTHQSGGS